MATKDMMQGAVDHFGIVRDLVPGLRRLNHNLRCSLSTSWCITEAYCLLKEGLQKSRILSSSLGDHRFYIKCEPSIGSIAVGGGKSLASIHLRDANSLRYVVPCADDCVDVAQFISISVLIYTLQFKRYLSELFKEIRPGLPVGNDGYRLVEYPSDLCIGILQT